MSENKEIFTDPQFAFLTICFLENLPENSDGSITTEFIIKMVSSQPPSTWNEYFRVLNRYAKIINNNFCIPALMNNLRIVLLFWSQEDTEYNHYVDTFYELLKIYDDECDFDDKRLPEFIPVDNEGIDKKSDEEDYKIMNIAIQKRDSKRKMIRLGDIFDGKDK